MIPPGGQGQVTASIDSTKFKGPISKSVSLYTNDPEHERTSLTLRALIKVPIDVRPRERVIVKGKPSDMKPEVLELVSVNGTVFDITSVSKREDDIHVSFAPAPELEFKTDGKPKKPKLDKKALASGHSAYRMTVSLDPKTQPGRLSDRIRVETTHPKMSHVDVTVTGQIEGDVTVRPDRLFFLTRNGVSNSNQTVTLTRRPEGGLEIKKITSSDPTFETTVVPVSEGKEYKIEVTRKAEAVGTPAMATITIETNDPVQSKIEIPVTAR